MTTNTNEEYEAHIAWLMYTERPISTLEVMASPTNEG